MNKLTLQNIRHAFENAILLGKGTNGIAFKIVIGNKEYVLKLTSSFSEYQIALKIKKLQQENSKVKEISALVYLGGLISKLNIEINELSYKWFIITEYLEVNNKTKKYSENNLYGKLFKICIKIKTTISNLLNFDLNRLKTFWKTYYDKNDNFAEFLLVINILKLHKTLKSNDFHSGNIGKDKNGNYKAFDFDVNKQRKQI